MLLYSVQYRAAEQQSQLCAVESKKSVKMTAWLCFCAADDCQTTVEIWQIRANPNAIMTLTQLKVSCFLFLQLLNMIHSEIPPVFSGEKLHGVLNITANSTDPRSHEFTPWSPCTATCAPSYRVRKLLVCPPGPDERCSEVMPCNTTLPECGSDSYPGIDVFLKVGDTENFTCPLHPREPALRLVWYHWLNDTWTQFYSTEDSRILIRDHTHLMEVRSVTEGDQGSYKCVLKYPDGKVKTAFYYHIKVSRHFTLLLEILMAVGAVILVALIALIVYSYCLPNSKGRLPCFRKIKVESKDSLKKLSETNYSRLNEEPETVIKWTLSQQSRNTTNKTKNKDQYNKGNKKQSTSITIKKGQKLGNKTENCKTRKQKTK